MIITVIKLLYYYIIILLYYYIIMLLYYYIIMLYLKIKRNACTLDINKNTLNYRLIGYK